MDTTTPSPDPISPLSDQIRANLSQAFADEAQGEEVTWDFGLSLVHDAGPLTVISIWAPAAILGQTICSAFQVPPPVVADKEGARTVVRQALEQIRQQRSDQLASAVTMDTLPSGAPAPALTSPLLAP